MSATSKTMWFWSDWLGDEAVRRLTPAERGVWIDLLALAAAGTPRGFVCNDKGEPLTLDEIARVTNAGSPDEVAKHIAGILTKGAASRDRTGRLFNRRMVRDTELSAKRSRAGRKGAAHTNLINKNFRALSQQMPRQVMQQNKTGPPHPYPKERKKTSSFTSSSFCAAREGGDAVLNAADSKEVGDPVPARALATALPAGALAPAPDAEDAAEKRKPNEMSRSELEQLFAARRSAASS